MQKMYKVGQSIFTKFGQAKIKKIELAQDIETASRQKEGIDVSAIWEDDLDRAIIDLDNNHFIYGEEISKWV